MQWLSGSDWRATFIPEQDHGPCTYPPRPNPEKHVLMSNWKGQEEEFLVGHDWLFLTQSLPNIQQTCTYSWLILKSYWFAICDTYARLEAWPRSTVHDHGGSTFSVKFRTSKIKSCIQLKQFKKQFGLQFTVHLKPGSHLLLATQIMARMHVLFNRFRTDWMSLLMKKVQCANDSISSKVNHHYQRTVFFDLGRGSVWRVETQHRFCHFLMALHKPKYAKSFSQQGLFLQTTKAFSKPKWTYV